MRELRLVPAALVAWAVTLGLLIGVPRVGLVVVAVVVGFAVARHVGQAIVTAVVGTCAWAVTSARLAMRPPLDDEFLAQLTAAPKQVESGSWLLTVRIDDHPGTVAVFADELPKPECGASGAIVHVAGTWSESDRVSLAGHTVSGSVELVAPPTGFQGWAAQVRATFAESVAAHVPEHSQGLIPGVVLGDTSLQSAAEQDAYIATGLSHLSAVSGANVAIVTTAAAIAARLVGLGLRGQVAASAVALSIFVGLVGSEPSVLRAAITGVVGLVAVLASSASEPIHALSLAVIALVFLDSDMAANYGFALSVAATAGIIVLHPLLYRALAPTGWPDIVVRALAVAIAADIVTMPIIALMAGEVSLVSVVANVLVAPATPPVTVLGLVAVLLSLIPGGLEQLVYLAITPLTWWINFVGTHLAQLPVATVEATPWYTLLGYGWVIAGFLLRRPRITVVVAVCAYFAASWQPLPPAIDLERAPVHIVDTLHDTAREQVPPGIAAIIVLDDEGPAATRPTVTTERVPVLYPNRDGPVTVHVDGTQHAADGRF
ncbi:ComEC/Rec2 family competence protein [Corynebacterium cystitidis]|uniref:ComEC/Rec2 family competence protein n=1 Tax=Corynebacterium cystitidis TaxID=35757 RepID=UPI00211F35EF|nr:ComEC/Rec2 family competence protein [Corynebacterium cystitidis]